MPCFEVIQKAVDVLKRLFIVIAAVQAGLQAVFPDDSLCLALFRGISAFAHQANAGNQPLVLLNEPLQVREQWFSHVLLQIL